MPKEVDGQDAEEAASGCKITGFCQPACAISSRAEKAMNGREK